jgi:hypothetical protein
MKNRSLATFLFWALFVSTLASCAFCWLLMSNTREWRNLQRDVNAMNSFRTGVNALVSDTIEYSKKNPAVDPILESFGMKQAKSGTTATNKPTSK